jgi:hypothetical protein
MWAMAVAVEDDNTNSDHMEPTKDNTEENVSAIEVAAVKDSESNMAIRLWASAQGQQALFSSRPTNRD